MDVHAHGARKRYWTYDVGAHGLFLLMSEPPRERHVLKLTIHLPDGPVAAVAYGTHTSQRGMGVQFFSLAGEAKRRWDAYLSALGAPSSTDALESGTLGDATFIVKLKTLDALRDFARHCLDAGGTYLRTPVLRAVGSPVSLAMVHPLTEQELVLTGLVMRLHQQRPKGMEIQFTSATLARKHAFERFVETGIAPAVEKVVDAHPNLESGDADTLEGDAAGADEDPFDIDVLEDDPALRGVPLDDEHTFAWDHVSEELLIDIGLGDELGTFELPTTSPGAHVSERAEPPSPSQEGESLPPALTDLVRPFFQVVVRCDACDMLDVELDVGAPPGALGLVSRLAPRYCPTCRTLVTTTLPAPPERRDAVLAALLERGPRGHVVPMQLLFDVARLSDAPACPICRTSLQASEEVRALEEELLALEEGRELSREPLGCGICKSGTWTVERVEPPIRIEV